MILSPQPSSLFLLQQYYLIKLICLTIWLPNTFDDVYCRWRCTLSCSSTYNCMKCLHLHIHSYSTSFSTEALLYIQDCVLIVTLLLALLNSITEVMVYVLSDLFIVRVHGTTLMTHLCVYILCNCLQYRTRLEPRAFNCMLCWFPLQYLLLRIYTYSKIYSY